RCRLLHPAGGPSVSTETVVTRYATPDELAAVEAERAAIATAAADVQRIGNVLADTREQLQEAIAKQPSWHARAAARALGEIPAAAPAGPTRADLADQERGLVDRYRTAQDAVMVARGRARGAWMHLVAECARRCM